MGSILHFARPNDILCGIGYKPSERFDSKILKKLNILALRGPKTYDFLKAQGADLSKLKSLYDPGLLVRFLYQDLIQQNDYPIKNKISFLPHYRERNKNLMKQKNIHIIDIDNSVENVCQEILNSELIYTSSLHGLIFAHALNRPAVLVSPQSNEDMLKYKDYLASISVEYRPPFKDIHDAMKHNHSCSPISLNYKYEDIYLPDLELLKQHGVVV